MWNEIIQWVVIIVGGILVVRNIGPSVTYWQVERLEAVAARLHADYQAIINKVFPVETRVHKVRGQNGGTWWHVIQEQRGKVLKQSQLCTKEEDARILYEHQNLITWSTPGGWADNGYN